MPKDSSAVAVSWKRLAGAGAATLVVRPFLSGRDSHALHHENPAFRFDASGEPGGLLAFHPYPDVPAVVVRSNGAYEASPEWYRNFLYAEEKARGLDSAEDLAAPGTFRFDLSAGEAIWLAAAQGHESALGVGGAEAALATLRSTERRRRASLGDRLDRAADAYLVRRGSGRTIVAGYPWFTDWGRDTFIALRGLCLATGRLEDAEGILLEWAGTVSQGMLPNFFPDASSEPEFNAVDASLWYVVAVYEYFEAMAAAGRVALAVERGEAPGRDRGDPRGLRRGDAIRNPRRRRRPARRGAARRAADLDGREGRRLGRDAADRQARRGAGALVERPLDRGRVLGPVERAPRPRARVLSRAFLERGGGLPLRRRGPRSRRGNRGRDRSAEPDLRRRRPPVRARSRGSARAGSSTRSRRALCDARRPSLPVPGGSGLPGAIRGRAAPARRRLPPGDRLAVSRRGLRGRVGAGAARARRRRSPRRASASSLRSWRISTKRDSATSPRSPTAMRRTLRAAARSRPGRSGSCCGSTA